jgi:P-type Cu+ transporter
VVCCLRVHSRRPHRHQQTTHLLQAAGEVADVILLSNRPSQVLDAITLSKATMTKIRQNLAWAFGYNLLGIPIAAGVLLPGYGVALTPSISGALMGMSSLAVMANSLLLRREAGRESLVDETESAGGSAGTVSIFGSAAIKP